MYLQLNVVDIYTETMLDVLMFKSVDLSATVRMSLQQFLLAKYWHVLNTDSPPIKHALHVIANI